ncbi:MAG: HDOD domain-containing protein [Planctomycetota bacterium]
MSGPHSVLVVDRLSIIREPIAAAIGARGYLTLTAEDGEEAYEVATMCKASLLVLDLDLPKLDGVELLRRLREHGAHRKTPAILLIDGLDLSAVERAVAFGVRDYVIKSRFTMASLMNLVTKHCPPSAKDAIDAATPEPPAHQPSPSPKPVPSPVLPPAPRASPHPGKRPRAAASPIYHPPIQDHAVLKTLKPLMTRASIDAVIADAHRLPVLASTPPRILEMLERDDGSLLDAAEVARHDPALTLHLLAQANGPRFDDASPAITLPQVLGRLGLDALRELIDRVETQPLPGIAADSEADAPAFDGAGFWDHSVAVAMMTAELTREAACKPDEIEAAYVAGLIHDLGRRVMSHRLGPTYTEILETARTLRTPLVDTEKHLLLEDHASLMEKALTAMGVGPGLTHVVGLHHADPGRSRHLAGPHQGVLTRLRLADALAHAQMLSDGGDDAITATDALIKALNIPPDRVRQMLEKLPGQLKTARGLALPTAAPEGHSPEAVRRLTQAPHPPRPAFVGIEPDADPLAVVARRLNPQGSTPNLLIAHVRSVRERGDITARLRSVELGLGRGKLPLVIVSPKGNIELDESATLGRAVRSLGLPLTPAELIRTLNKLTAGSVAEAA